MFGADMCPCGGVEVVFWIVDTAAPILGCEQGSRFVLCEGTAVSATGREWMVWKRWPRQDWR